MQANRGHFIYHKAHMLHFRIQKTADNHMSVYIYMLRKNKPREDVWGRRLRADFGDCNTRLRCFWQLQDGVEELGRFTFITTDTGKSLTPVTEAAQCIERENISQLHCLQSENIMWCEFSFNWVLLFGLTGFFFLSVKWKKRSVDYQRLPNMVVLLRLLKISFAVKIGKQLFESFLLKDWMESIASFQSSGEKDIALLKFG